VSIVCCDWPCPGNCATRHMSSMCRRCALSNDIQRNLQGPLEELLALARQQDLSCPEIRVAVRTGDTPQREHWDEVYERLVHLIETHKTLIFVNTRKLAER